MKKLISVVLSASALFVSVMSVSASPSDIPFEERELTVDTVSINRA